MFSEKKVEEKNMETLGVTPFIFLLRYSKQTNSLKHSTKHKATPRGQTDERPTSCGVPGTFQLAKHKLKKKKWRIPNKYVT